MANFVIADYFRLVNDSVNGNPNKIKNAYTYLLMTFVALSLWIVLSSSGTKEVFLRINQFQQMVDSMGKGKAAFAEIQKANVPDSSFFSFFSSKKEPKLSPFLRGVIANICAILAVLLFLGIFAKQQRHSQPFSSSIVTISVATVPLSIGVAVSYAFFATADGLTSEDLPTILYIIGTLCLITSIITAIIVLYVAVMGVLNIRSRKRYFATIISLYLAVGIFSWMARWLSSPSPA